MLWRGLGAGVLTLRWLILCDWNEAEGRDAVTLHGVRDAFRLDIFPGRLRIAVAAMVDCSEAGVHALRFELQMGGATLLVAADQRLDLPDLGSAFVSDLLDFTASRPALLHVVAFLDGVDVGRAPVQLLERRVAPTPLMTTGQ